MYSCRIISKETWGKWGITAVKHGNKKENIIDLWHKMSDAGRQIGHSNIAEVVLGRIKKYYGKKKTFQKKKNKNIKPIF